MLIELFVALMLHAQHVAEHPAWLRDQKTVSPVDGLHCCGPKDCWGVPDKDVFYRGDRIWFRSKGSLWSIERKHLRFRQDTDQKEWMVCRGNPVTKGLACAFRPYGGVRRDGDRDT